ncbi:MAG: GNAT family N-acetyltransferase [Oleiphilaceae bacterium]|nr:GNAT family N-acetyltransferase [Oleiphilaceae bacterium]
MPKVVLTIGKVEVIKADKFCPEVETAWQELEVHGSLFNSYTWLKTWWDIWGKQNSLELSIFIFLEDQKAIALLPLYKEAITQTSSNNFQFLGNIYPTGTTILSEYTDILVKPSKIEQTHTSLLQLLRELDFNKITLAYANPDNLFLRIAATKFNSITKTMLPDGWVIETNQSFEKYKASLGKNTRLKLFNRRTKLEEKYPNSLLSYATNTNDICEYLDLLNIFHAQRWGNHCFNEHSLAFHVSIAETLLEQGLLKLSLLSVNDQPISVLYNLRFGQAEYNIQSGYLEKFDPKISLGTLHLGYAIESTFKQTGISCLDMLMGQGKNADYKASLGKLRREFSTFTIYKNKFAKLKGELQIFGRKVQRKLTMAFNL